MNKSRSTKRDSGQQSSAGKSRGTSDPEQREEAPTLKASAQAEGVPQYTSSSGKSKTLGSRTEGARASESQTHPEQGVSTVAHDAMHVGPSSGKIMRDTAESKSEFPEKSRTSPVSGYVPKCDVKPKVKESKFSKDIEKKLAQLLIGSDKGQLDASYFPVLVANAPSEQINTEEELNEKFGFMSSVNWNVAFDCNPESNDTGLCSIVTKRRHIYMFSPQKFQTRDYNKLKEDIEFPEVPVWLYPNGRLDASEDREEKLSYGDWIRERSRAVLDAVRFFSHPEVIPPGRAVVIFLLLSDSDIMVMTQIFKEFYTSTSFQSLQCFTVLAEDDNVMQKWMQSLEIQQFVNSNEMKLRCLSGIPWKEISTNMLSLLETCETTVPQLPMSPKGPCELKQEHQSQWTDISVLASNECENTSMDDRNPVFPNFVREKEEKFYQGHEVDWWNFHLSEGKDNGYNHVLRRECCDTLFSEVSTKLQSRGEKISSVTVFHEPGSGGTTVAKNVLWELHKEYRCAVVKRLTNDTVNQIMALRRYNYEKSDKPAPVVILLDNLDSESKPSFLNNLEREAKNDTDEGLAILLLQCERTNEPENFGANDEGQSCVVVQHKLSPKEHDWFLKKTEDLEKRGLALKDTPEQLLAFMVMKEECRSEYLRVVVRRILPALSYCTHEEKMALAILKYIAAMHKYCPKFAMPVPACDQYMQENVSFAVSMTAHKKKRPWEKERPKFLKLLLIDVVIHDIDGRVQGLRIAHCTLAEEILSQLQHDFNQTPADIFLEFLESSVLDLDPKTHGKAYIKTNCRYMMVHRNKKKDGDENENFSPLIEDAYKEDNAKAIKILEVWIHKFEDPFIAQQKARLHSMYDHDYDEAEQSIDTALALMRENSYLWDTKGIILREKMADFDGRKEEGPLSDEDIKKILKIFEDACSAFQQGQSVNKGEAERNNGSFIGEIITIFKFLGIIQKRVEPFSYPRKEGLGKMRLYLTTDFIPDELVSSALQDHHSVLKSLVERVETLVGCVTDYMAQCDWKRCPPKHRITKKKLEQNYDNRNKYFGLTFQNLPTYHQDSKTANAVRRGKVMKQIKDGYGCIFEMVSRDKVSTLKSIQDMLNGNLSSQLYLFDVRSWVLVSFALGMCSEEHFDEDETRHWVQKLKELEEETDRFYGLFFEMILNWPDRTSKKSHIPPIKGTIKGLEHRWGKKYNRVPKPDVPSTSRKRIGLRQNVYPLKSATDFYLGKQGRFRLIHKSKIGKITHAVWKGQEVKRLLSSLKGVLYDEQHLIYNPQREPMKIPLALPVQDLPSGEPVTFFLGFSFSGPVAYGVRYRNERDSC